MSALQKSFFTTQFVCPDKRLDVWKESIDTLFDVTPAPQSGSARCHTTVASYLIDNQIMFSGCATHAQRFERQPLRVARDSLDYFVLQTHLSGRQELKRGRKTVNCTPGDLMVLDLAERHDAITTAFTQRSLVIPRHMIAPHLTEPDNHAARVLKADSPLATLAVNHLKSTFNLLGSMTEKESLQIIQPTVLLIAGALNGSVERVADGSSAVSNSLLIHAKAEIEKNLQKHITVDRLSASLRHSRSTLYRLFEPFGGVRSYVQERRLRRSAHELLSTQGVGKRICDIAYTWGFASEAHYSRAFRQRFGMTPGEARASRLESHTAASDTGLAEVGDREYEKWLGETLRI